MKTAGPVNAKFKLAFLKRSCLVYKPKKINGENRTMSVLKIGVLTFHRCINYGSYWQARCLVEGLQSLGHDAVILDHDSRAVNMAEWRCAYQPVLPTAVPKSDQPLYREKIEKFFSAFDKLPLSPRFQLHQPNEMDTYDVVVVGSDEVWNLYHPWYSGCPLFYGDGVRAQHLVAYAASFGNYSASWGLGKEWAERLRNFSSISVRDENSQVIVTNAIGTEPQMVLDPCLQFSIKPDERPIERFKKPYVAVYGHNFSPFYVREIKMWAAHKNLPLVSIGYRNDWADEQWITADPHDFAHFMAASEAVATNFFHGCVFALLNAKPFVCETSPYRSNKLQGLMTKIGGEGHLVTEEAPFSVYEAHLSQSLNPNILQKIDRLRQTSNIFLAEALNVQKLQLA